MTNAGTGRVSRVRELLLDGSFVMNLGCRGKPAAAGRRCAKRVVNT